MGFCLVWAFVLVYWFLFVLIFVFEFVCVCVLKIERQKEYKVGWVGRWGGTERGGEET